MRDFAKNTCKQHLNLFYCRVFLYTFTHNNISIKQSGVPMKQLPYLCALIILSTAAPLYSMQKGHIVDQLNQGIAPAQIAYNMEITPHETPDLWNFLHKKVEKRIRTTLQIHLDSGSDRMAAVLQTIIKCEICDQALDTNRLQKFVTAESLKIVVSQLQHRQSIPLQRRDTTDSGGTIYTPCYKNKRPHSVLRPL